MTDKDGNTPTGPAGKNPLTIHFADKVCPIMSNRYAGLGHVPCLGEKCARFWHCYPTYVVYEMGEVIEMKVSGEEADSILYPEDDEAKLN